MPYKFSWTPFEAQATAAVVADYFDSKGYKVRIEHVVDSEGEQAPYRPTVTASDGELVILIEAQGSPEYTAELSDLARWMSARRLYGELYIATEVAVETKFSTKNMSQMHREGVGLLLVEEDGTVRAATKASNPRLSLASVCLPDQKYGDCRHEVKEIMDDYNVGNRLAACRSIAELVEGQIRKLALKAAKKGWLDKDEATIESMDQSNRIHAPRGRRRVYNGSVRPLLMRT